MNSSKYWYFIGIYISFLMYGCTTDSDVALKTFKSTFNNQSAVIENASLNKELSYLRVNVVGLDALLVKGYADQDKNGAIDVWYSSDGSMMRLQKGRYLGSVGFDRNWQNVEFKDAPNLINIVEYYKRPAISPQLKSVADFYPKDLYFFSRNKTQMPEYQTALQERMSISVSDQAPKTIPKSLKPYLQNKELVWVSEKPLSTQDKTNPRDNFAWYGFEKKNSSFIQVFGQQCFSPDFCISWMPWPIQ